MTPTDGLIDLAFKFADDTLRKQIVTEINKTVKTLADKYATYVNVNWKAVCDSSNNPQSIVDQHKIVLDIYITVPTFMPDFVKVHIETSVSSTPSLPK